MLVAAVQSCLAIFIGGGGLRDHCYTRLEVSGTHLTKDTLNDLAKAAEIYSPAFIAIQDIIIFF